MTSNVKCRIESLVEEGFGDGETAPEGSILGCERRQLGLDTSRLQKRRVHLPTLPPLTKALAQRIFVFDQWRVEVLIRPHESQRPPPTTISHHHPSLFTLHLAAADTSFRKEPGVCRELEVDYEEDVMLRMAMMRNHTVSDRPVPGESKGPEKRRLFSEAAWRTDRREDAAGSSPICSNGSHWPLDMAFKD
ncbi:unnamed protein product [Pleuronectes platessa]|uniref:Uncharacterized protein n=1 Tax=Pleuronectes platessa TaxID=8262 RepID=A0A9N7TT00_PLEPL|nr:unnamed protein product [Pleuronectes platessa]